MTISKLDEAKTLLEQPMTLSNLRRFRQLSQGSGAEAESIRELGSSLRARIAEDEDLFFSALEQGLL